LQNSTTASFRNWRHAQNDCKFGFWIKTATADASADAISFPSALTASWSVNECNFQKGSNRDTFAFNEIFSSVNVFVKARRVQNKLRHTQQSSITALHGCIWIRSFWFEFDFFLTQVPQKFLFSSFLSTFLFDFISSFVFLSRQYVLVRFSVCFFVAFFLDFVSWIDSFLVFSSVECNKNEVYISWDLIQLLKVVSNVLKFKKLNRKKLWKIFPCWMVLFYLWELILTFDLSIVFRKLRTSGSGLFLGAVSSWWWF